MSCIIEIVLRITASLDRYLMRCWNTSFSARPWKTPPGLPNTLNPDDPRKVNFCLPLCPAQMRAGVFSFTTF